MAYDLARKRPYQPSLAAYFHHQLSYSDSSGDSQAQRADRSSNSSFRAPKEINANSAPQLSNSVQASLLSVGMRVRKAVHDGYRFGHRQVGHGKSLQAPRTDTIMSNTSEAPFDGEITLSPSADDADADKENRTQNPKRKHDDDNSDSLDTNSSRREYVDMQNVPAKSSVFGSDMLPRRAIATATSRRTRISYAEARRNNYVRQIAAPDDCMPQDEGRMETVDDTDFGEAAFLCARDETATPPLIAMR